ncbi:SnoaL-like polyketide cyclase [Candidatus Methanoperedens nitroreducens]|uniref:SnoaL-like polyketide cyclase n=1 Tax=Candidatus Methanoperedens nitratireducens TaxID=1392998 RepID=A0A062V0U7_9EURY|nr:ester cyclase [Candidatus Methanoperedens nitroreducens]KCZ72771.1 SnoaL-like polyketide cyclase [Candidatus Methanoperedens nitroreducens]MDJ1423299.1 ester cyclase [Candidatus Methanoperedens sp.]
MSTEENKAIIRRFYEKFFNKGNLAIIDELFSPNYIHHVQDVPGSKVNLEGYKKRNSTFFNAFPDRRVIIDDPVAEADRGFSFDDSWQTNREYTSNKQASDSNGNNHSSYRRW